MNTFILIVTVFVTFAPDARAGRCLGELNGPTGEQAVQILRTLQDIAPTLSVEELAAQPRRVRALTEKLGFARTPKALEADLKRLFGHRIAALEFAGFDTSTLPNPTPDRDDWTPKLVRDGIRLGRYGAEFDPTPRGFLLQWRRIEAGLAKGWGRPVSAYSLWRAARAQYGNYQSALARTDGRADPHDRASHSSDAIRRLPLIPGAAAARRAGERRVPRTVPPLDVRAEISGFSRSIR